MYEIDWFTSTVELDGTQVMEMSKIWCSSAPTWKRGKTTKPYGLKGKGINKVFVLPVKMQ